MMAAKKKVTILDCTLRDGSYAIDYQFTEKDTTLICRALQDAGVEYIEVGHGVGFNGSEKHGKAVATDEEYVRAASEALTTSKFGMFCIPGIARLEDLDLAAHYDMDFVRVGTNVTEVEGAEPFIRKAHALGMMVHSNFMKSYALPVQDVVERAKKVRDWGAEVVAVVDSAGCMLPDEVRAYVSAVRQEVDGIEVGFHGHNNLGLAVANSLAAVQAGAAYVDTTLQSIGRSIGNTQTEVMALVLEKAGYKTGIDRTKIMAAGDTLVRPRMRENKGIDSLSATLGYARFHSSFLPILEKVAQAHHLDVRDLVVEVSKTDIVKVSEESAEQAARALRQAQGKRARSSA